MEGRNLSAGVDGKTEGLRVGRAKTGLVMKLVDEPLGAKSKLRQKEETKKKAAVDSPTAGSVEGNG
jgi:hypothetical protein